LVTQTLEETDYAHNFSPELPDYQRHNWLLAYAAYRFLRQRDGLPELTPKQLLATQALQVPGRMDRRQVNEKLVVMDGAHNGQKMETFIQSFKRLYPDTKPAVMLALKEGKEPVDVAPLLTEFASRIIVTTFQTSQDLPAKSIDPVALAEIFRRAGATQVVTIPDMHEAYRALLASPDKICVVTGSFYLLSQLRSEEGLA
jgi:folylpolyglutamate synthase/dihydropteroate synthase